MTYSSLSEKERKAVQNVNFIIDHPEQKPDTVTKEGHLVFHYRPETKTAELKQSENKLDRLFQK